MMTTYRKYATELIGERYPNAEEGLKLLLRIGVVNETKMNAIVVRNHIRNSIKNGEKIMDAIYNAADHFKCSFECARKYWYYYTDCDL